MSKSVIEVKKLNVKVANKEIISNLSFSVLQGEKVAIKGKSGSGKSTLLHTLMGFVVPFEGEIFFHGKKLEPKTISAIRSNLAWVPQNVFLPFSRVKDMVFHVLSFKNNSHILFDRKLWNNTLKQLDLDVDINTNFQNLSGGEKQRIFLAVASLLNKPFIFLDEPTAALDDKTKLSVSNFLKNNEKSTMLFATHDEELLKIADRIILLL